jgi:lipid II:glycine glycyltransferase (peptidoglycan interpeptide bridge formation enzyme)
MQSHAWGELQRASGWEPHYLALGDGGAIRGVVLLLSRSVPGAGRVFYAPRGPVVDPSDAAAWRDLTAGLRAYLRRQRGIFVRLDPYQIEAAPTDEVMTGAGLRPLAREWSYWNAPRFVLWLDLRDRDEDTLFKGMTSTCRNEVRSGYKKGTVFSVGGADDIGDFYRLMTAMGQTKGVAVHEEAYYRRLYEGLSRSCDVALFLGRLDGTAIAAGMSVRFGDRAWLLYAASDRAYSKLRANRTLQWEMIRWALAGGCTRYDFRGTATGDPPSPSDPGYGVYEFKKSFGPEFVRLTAYRDLVVGRLRYRALRLGEERALPELYRAKLWLDERRSHARRGSGES